MESLLVRLEIGWGSVDTNDDGGDDDDDVYDDENVWYWLGKSDVGTSIREAVNYLELLPLIIL